MRILLGSPFFYPSIGGVETLSQELAETWQTFGHKVHVVTTTPLEKHDEIEELEISRQPAFSEMRRLVNWADVFVRSGNSLRSIFWPLLTGTPSVTIHHRPLSSHYIGRFRSVVEQWTTYLGGNVAVSGAVEETIPGPSIRIPNTFRPTFDCTGSSDEERDGLLFVGRLVTRKGVDTLIGAMHHLHGRGINETLTIYGDGPERSALSAKARRLGVDGLVLFEGWASPETLARRYRRSKVTVIPSRMEPFGIVALEAIASGCPVVASNAGGLPEAVGECGVLVEPDRSEELAEAIERALRPSTRAVLRDAMPEHVARHRTEQIATEYMSVLKSVTADTTE
jgi:glycosyltransferase involved in cell wall biosynthesis